MNVSLCKSCVEFEQKLILNFVNIFTVIQIKVPEIHAPAQGGTQLETPKIEVIREPTPDRKSSLAPGV